MNEAEAVAGGVVVRRTRPGSLCLGGRRLPCVGTDASHVGATADELRPSRHAADIGAALPVSVPARVGV